MSQSSQPKTTIDGIRTKIARAHEHCSALDDEIRSFINSKPYRISYEFNPENREHMWKLVTDPPTIPSRIHAIIGDALYNWRSSLDHVVWQLVLANGGQPDLRTEFPIFIDLDKFERESKRKLRGVSETAKSFIARVQPCYGGYEILWALQELSNMDKHRHLPIVFVNVTQVTSQIPFPIEAGQKVQMLINTGPVVRGTVLVAVVHDEVEMDFEPEFGIAFGDGTPVEQQSVMDVFRAIRIPVISIVEELTTLLTK